MTGPTEPFRVLLVSGSLRVGSTSTSALRTVAADAGPAFVAELYGGVRDLPHFDPDDDRDPLPAAVAALRGAIRAADGLLISTPEYAGALPGALKNVLEWAIGDGHQRAIAGKPVGWLNVSPRTGGARLAHDALRTVLRYAAAEVVEAACIDVAVERAAVGADGLVAGGVLRSRLVSALRALAGGS